MTTDPRTVNLNQHACELASQPLNLQRNIHSSDHEVLTESGDELPIAATDASQYDL